MVYLVKVKNKAKGKKGTLLALVQTDNKSLVRRILNLDLEIEAPTPEDVSIMKQLPEVSVNNNSSVSILYYIEKESEEDSNTTIQNKLDDAEEESESKGFTSEIDLGRK